MRDFGLRRVLLASLLLPVLPTAGHSQCNFITGTGCGPLGTPSGLTCVGSPTAGNASFGLNGTIQQSPLLLVGLCATSPLTVSAAGLCPLSGPSCVVGLDPSLLIPVSGFPFFPNFFFPLPIPNDPALVGATVCAQKVGVEILFGFGTCTAVSLAVSITVL